ncbi:MAG: hypothetical protein LBU32_01320 [Clostridiales bacterium]|nr:hypothetical protein [Clostridiales bacterium]
MSRSFKSLDQHSEKRSAQIRFKLPACGRAINEEIAGLDSRHRISSVIELFIMESLCAAAKGEIARQTGISVSSAAYIARLYSECMKSNIVSKIRKPLYGRAIR